MSWPYCHCILLKKNTFQLKTYILPGAQQKHPDAWAVIVYHRVSSGIVLIVFNLIIIGLAGNTNKRPMESSRPRVGGYCGIYRDCTGIQPLASTGYGRDDKKMLGQVLGYAAGLAVILAVSVYIVVSLFSDPIIHIFNNEGTRR
ncbi:MAG: MATE family efflux transporter [Eisenbergiella sp.]